MTIPREQCLAAVVSFMEARCAVSSQHKLPTMDEILSTATARIIGVERTRGLVEELVSIGVLIQYGPHYSDHDVEVL